MAVRWSVLGSALLLLQLGHRAWAVPLLEYQEIDSPLRSRQLLNPPYTLPQNANDPLVRAAGITTKRTTFLYGPGESGGPYSPSGPLGLEYVANDSTITDTELAAQHVIDSADQVAALAGTPKYNGLQTLQDYTLLYDDEWQASSAPTGIDPGMLTNYTQDLLFSMERLSFNPTVVRRLVPGKDTLPFTVPDATARKVTGSTLSSLLQAGRLFYADHRTQGQYPHSPDKYSAACDALFYISAKSGQFLPAAIRTTAGSNLIYTPADQPNDWLLAKMLFNINDFFQGQFHHLAATHYVAEIVYESAVRTLSDDHPVLAILKRLMYGAFGIRPLAASILFPPVVGFVDRFFSYTGSSAMAFSDSQYNGAAGQFQANYLRTDLQNRGLINFNGGPALAHFPYYEDASAIHDAQRAFMGSFVASYYPNAATMRADKELQAWIAEANGPAKVENFPSAAQLNTPAGLADALTHMAHLVTSAHHAVNTNQLITGSGVLPFHPGALYKPPPQTKGASDLASYLPNVTQCSLIIQAQGDFARPLLASTNRSLIHMFDDPGMLSRLNAATRAANTKFVAAMQAQSRAVSSRTFDSQGLSQGMPFVWKGLDPNVAPFSSTV